MSWLDELTCKVCGSEDCVPAHGPGSDILIIGARPGETEVETGIPASGQMGAILRTEFAILGIDISRCRITNLWRHIPNKNDECLQEGFKKAIEECTNKKHILLLGAEPVKMFTGYSVDDTCGLWLDSPYVSVPVMSCVNPAQMFYSSSIGEMRLAFQKFVKEIGK